MKRSGLTSILQREFDPAVVQKRLNSSICDSTPFCVCCSFPEKRLYNVFAPKLGRGPFVRRGFYADALMKTNFCRIYFYIREQQFNLTNLGPVV